MKTRAGDERTEREIREIEEYWAVRAPKKYPGWSWMQVPDHALEEIDSYHRLAPLKLGAEPFDWESPLTKLGVPGAVDFHSHLEGYPETPGLVSELVEVLDGAGVGYIVSLPLYKFWDVFKRELEEWRKGPLSERVVNFVTFDWPLDEPGFVERACSHLDEVQKMGARGLKVHKNVGLTVRSRGKVAKLYDSRYREIFSHAGEIGMPILIHYGDPFAFFKPLAGNGRQRELSCFPAWHWYPEFTEKDYWQLQEDFLRMLEAVAGANFVVAHLGNYPWARIDEFARLLEHYPNLYSDTSGRMAAIGKGRMLEGREDRAIKAREILSRCRNKILWGTDILPTARLYKLWAYFLRSEQKNIDYTWATFYPGQGDWLVDGLGLDQPVLDKFCRDVAKSLLHLE